MFIAFVAAATAAIPKATAIDPASWFSSNNYPIEAIKQGIEGSVTFDVDVDATGKPTACRITVSSGHPILDQATCDIVRSEGRFIPAKKADGKPIAGHYSNRAIWRMPNMIEPAYRATIVDFSADPLHPVCTVENQGPEIGGPTCEQWEQQATSVGVGQHLTKLVYLVSMASGREVPFPGKPEWGSRVSYQATDAYYMKSSYPVACIDVASEGLRLGHGGCAAFPGTHAPTDEEKAKAIRTRVEQSVFVVRRTSAQTQGLPGSAASSDMSSMGVHELEPGHFRCEAPAGDYINHEIAALPIRKPVTVRFRLISEHPDPKWLEQTAIYFETPLGRRRIQVGKADNDPQHIYVALLHDNNGQSEVVDQYPFSNDWIALTLILKDNGTVQVASRGHQASLDLGTPWPVKTEIHCHSGAFEIQVSRPPQ